jgi:hypothetical protein
MSPDAMSSLSAHARPPLPAALDGRGDAPCASSSATLSMLFGAGRSVFTPVRVPLASARNRTVTYDTTRVSA